MKIGRPFGLYCNFHSHRYANLALIIYLGVSKLSETTGTSKKIFFKEHYQKNAKAKISNLSAYAVRNIPITDLHFVSDNSDRNETTHH